MITHKININNIETCDWYLWGHRPSNEGCGHFAETLKFWCEKWNFDVKILYFVLWLAQWWPKIVLLWFWFVVKLHLCNMEFTKRLNSFCLISETKLETKLLNHRAATFQTRRPSSRGSDGGTRRTWMVWRLSLWPLWLLWSLDRGDGAALRAKLPCHNMAAHLSIRISLLRIWNAANCRDELKKRSLQHSSICDPPSARLLQPVSERSRLLKIKSWTHLKSRIWSLKCKHSSNTIQYRSVVVKIQEWQEVWLFEN